MQAFRNGTDQVRGEGYLRHVKARIIGSVESIGYIRSNGSVSLMLVAGVRSNARGFVLVRITHVTNEDTQPAIGSSHLSLQGTMCFNSR